MKIVIKSIEKCKGIRKGRPFQDDDSLVELKEDGHYDVISELMMQDLSGKVIEVTPLIKDDKEVPNWFSTIDPDFGEGWNLHRSWFTEVD